MTYSNELHALKIELEAFQTKHADELNRSDAYGHIEDAIDAIDADMNHQEEVEIEALIFDGTIKEPRSCGQMFGLTGEQLGLKR